jgi:hypothetical protein
VFCIRNTNFRMTGFLYVTVSEGFRAQLPQATLAAAGGRAVRQALTREARGTYVTMTVHTRRNALRFMSTWPATGTPMRKSSTSESELCYINAKSIFKEHCLKYRPPHVSV